MTNEERRRAFALRLDGMSWERIGKTLGYCGTTISNDLSLCLRRGPRRLAICYPALRRYVVEQCGGSVKQLSAACRLPYSTLKSVLAGRQNPSKAVVDAILQATGLPYEAAFEKEAEDK